ncbi:hypothetical protein FKW77_010076 [Venturia effusa]|uniref:Uncharacterized protein n=1 Tax=Venturia effusa TaxID=50376 RepID=A0A517LA40_9PEZI|nr:hypothetical protein FKW77_010076 [Venturia effusa]
MAYVIAKPAKDAKKWTPVNDDAREAEIAVDKKRMVTMKKRRREGTKPDYNHTPEHGSAPEFKEDYWCWTSTVNGQTVCWDETTTSWMDKDLFAQKCTPDPTKSVVGRKKTLMKRITSAFSGTSKQIKKKREQ